MKKAVFLLGFGLLPLWATALYVWQGSIGAGSDYWNVAPWLIRLLDTRLRRHARHRRLDTHRLSANAGRAERKIPSGGQDLKQRAIALVRAHPAVLQEFGADFQTGLASMTTGAGERPERLEVRVSSAAKRLYAIVDVSGDDLRLACLTASDMGRRSSGQHPCQQ